MSIELLSISYTFLFIALAAKHFLTMRMVKNKLNNSIDKYLLKHNAYSFLLWRKKDNQIIFNKGLGHKIGIQDHISSFSYFANHFKQSTELDKLFTNSQSDCNSFSLELESINTLDCFICNGETIHDESGIVGVIICLADISKYITEIKLLKFRQQQLHNQYYKIEDTLNNIQTPIWRRDSNGNIEHGNDFYYQNITEELMKRIQNENKDLSHKKDYSSKHNVIINKERKVYQIKETSADHGDIVGIGHDITNLSKTEDRLNKYKESQHNIITNISIATALYDKNARIKTYNNSFLKIFNLDPKWLTQSPKYTEILDKLREKQTIPEQIDFVEFKRTQMNLFSLIDESHSEFLFMPNGKTLRFCAMPCLDGMLFTYEDISDRLSIERDYNKLILVQKRILNNLHEAISIYGQDGRLKSYNQKYVDITRLNTSFLDGYPHISDVMDMVSAKNTKALYKKTQLVNQIVNRMRTTNVISLEDHEILISSTPLPDGTTMLICNKSHTNDAHLH